MSTKDLEYSVLNDINVQRISSEALSGGPREQEIPKIYKGQLNVVTMLSFNQPF